MLEVKLDGQIEVATFTGMESKVAVIDEQGNRYALLVKDGEDRAWSGDVTQDSVPCRLVAEFMGELFEVFMGSGKFDDKGREIGWTVGLRDNGIDYHAWVQSARRPKNGEFHDFGVPQRSKKFDSLDASKRWAYATAKARIAKLN